MDICIHHQSHCSGGSDAPPGSWRGGRAGSAAGCREEPPELLGSPSPAIRETRHNQAVSVHRPPRSPLRSPSKPAVESSLKELRDHHGFSGAGKSTAMNVFEDAGYFCVDNLPPEMIRSLVDLFVHEGSKVERAAVVSDVRGGVYFEALQAVVDDLESLGLDHHVLFLEAAEQTLVNRYKETRRRHPLAPDGCVAAGVAAERALLEPLRNRADVVIDTTGMSAAMLRGKIADELLPRRAPGRLALTFMSFGFKHGPPREEDLAFDVRFLPNPHYVPDLRELTGKDPRVVEYVARDGRLEELYERLYALLDFLFAPVRRARAARISWSPSAAPAGGTARWRSPRSSPARYRDREDDLVVAVTHRDIDKRSRDS